MEKLPYGQRPEIKVVGGSEGEKEKFKQRAQNEFGEGHQKMKNKELEKELQENEIEKSDVEQEIIAVANELTNEVLKRFGCQPFDIPEKNIHIYPEKFYKEKIAGDGAPGRFSFYRQAILLSEEGISKNPYYLAIIILHEMIHAKNFSSLTNTKDDIFLRREGFKMHRKDRDADTLYTVFHGMNEAITEKIAKELFPDLLNSVSFFKHANENETDEFSLKLKDGIKDFTDEVYLFDKTTKKIDRFAYHEQRRVLDYVIQSLSEDNEDKFETKQNVLDLFYKAYFSGEVLEIARLIKKSFGEDAFRILGNISKEPQSAVEVLDYLEKKRRLKNNL